jgi:hypothetical protein
MYRLNRECHEDMVVDRGKSRIDKSSPVEGVSRWRCGQNSTLDQLWLYLGHWGFNCGEDGFAKMKAKMLDVIWGWHTRLLRTGTGFHRGLI